MRKKSLVGSGRLLRRYLKEIAFYEHLQEFGITAEGAEKVSVYKNLIPLIYDYLYQA